VAAEDQAEAPGEQDVGATKSGRFPAFLATRLPPDGQ
jgi:hypothetical protein